jgi:hypothetical protein
MVELPPPEPGTYRLYDRLLGPLPAGSYHIDIEQTLGHGGHTGTAKKYFDVTGPRWSLEPSDVHAVYPPENEQNATTECYVPFITLQRRTLPWERSLFVGNETPETCLNNPEWGDNDARKYPWVSLLLFTEDELTEGGKLCIFKGEDGIKLGASTNISDGTQEDGIFQHWSETERRDFGITAEMDQLRVDAIKLPLYHLHTFGPTWEDNFLLSHARQVNPLDKEKCGTDEDGWFSIVMSNRVLKPDTTYHACLVSLEGRLKDKLLVGMNSNYGQWCTDPKLVLLHHWTFKSSQIAGDFQTRVESLKVRIRSSNEAEFSDGDLIPLSAFNSASSDIEIEPLLLGTESTPGMTANSFLSTEMVRNDGITEDVLYRGPLIAYPENHYPKPEAYPVSDAAMALAQELGMWDISHASAFELGRLLSLSDARFTKAMKNWVASDIKMKLREERDAKIASRGLDRTSLQSNLEEMQNLNKVRAVASPFFSEEPMEAEATLDPNIDLGTLPSTGDETDSDESLIETYEQKNTGGEGNE